jgi:NtrC-family two-component system response regulator AlgB
MPKDSIAAILDGTCPSPRRGTHIRIGAGVDSLFIQSRSQAMSRLLEQAQRAAISDGTLLVTSESGTGKAQLARQIRIWSSRHSRSLVIVDCTALSQRRARAMPMQAAPALFEGANNSRAPIERAVGGSVFLEDLCELSAELQLALAQFLQDRTLASAEGEKTRDFRVIAATSRDLASEVAARRFREDLFYSLSIISLRLPALRERSEDILPMANEILTTAAIRNRRGELRISNEAAVAITSYRWPGNVRELRNAMAAAAVLCEVDTVTLAHLPEAVSKDASSPPALHPSRARLDQIEREHIAHVLAVAERSKTPPLHWGSTFRRYGVNESAISSIERTVRRSRR